MIEVFKNVEQTDIVEIPAGCLGNIFQDFMTCFTGGASKTFLRFDTDHFLTAGFCQVQESTQTRANVEPLRTQGQLLELVDSAVVVNGTKLQRSVPGSFAIITLSVSAFIMIGRQMIDARQENNPRFPAS